jgi:threonine aldolase
MVIWVYPIGSYPMPVISGLNEVGDRRAVVGERKARSLYSGHVTPPIDLRSDTVTKPTARMRRAMAEADVGDDWFGDDPTVNRLQERCAEVTGKDAALYVATGTMANEIAMHIFVRSGHLVVCEATAHVAGVEVSSAASLSGIAFAPVSAPRGQLTADMVAEALRPDPYDVDVVDLVAIENTHQVGGGTVMPADELRAIRKVAQEAAVPVYLDGARMFNAAAATGTAVSDYTAEVDAVMFCLSKGLGAPIGSVLCGSDEFIREARRVRVLFGGAWRQAGIMAAAGLVALEEGPGRLVEDHVNARRLADGIAAATPDAVDPWAVETNIVFADAGALGFTAIELRDRLAGAGLLSTVVAGKVRMLTHRDVTAGDVEDAIRIWGETASAVERGRAP